MIDPTIKQQELIAKIEKTLDVSFDEWCQQNDCRPSKRAASDFIDAHMADYLHECGVD